MVNEPDNPSDEAKFNFGLELLKRISREFDILEESLLTGDLILSRNILTSIYNEIDAFLNNTDRNEIKVIEDKLKDILDSYPNINDVQENNTMGKSSFRYKYFKERIEFKPLLIELDRKFRFLMKEKGLYMPPKNESGLF